MREKVPELAANTLRSLLVLTEQRKVGRVSSRLKKPFLTMRHVTHLPCLSKPPKIWRLYPRSILTPFREVIAGWAGKESEPPSGSGKLLWRALGKNHGNHTENIELVDVGEDFEKIVLDAALLEGMYLMTLQREQRFSKYSLQPFEKAFQNPVFIARERFEVLRRHEQVLSVSS